MSGSMLITEYIFDKVTGQEENQEQAWLQH